MRLSQNPTLYLTQGKQNKNTLRHSQLYEVAFFLNTNFPPFCTSWNDVALNPSIKGSFYCFCFPQTGAVRDPSAVTLTWLSYLEI